MSKAIDKAAGAEREVVGTNLRYVGMSDKAKRAQGAITHDYSAGWVGDPSQITAPATPEAARWQGWGTALKPGWEIIVVARKPLIGTVAANVLQYGTGALNIDGCRIGTGEQWGGNPEPSSTPNRFGPGDSDGWAGNWTKRGESHAAGRWPANVVLDSDAAAELDQQSGVLHSGSGGASRFFYVAEPDVTDRESGMIESCGTANTAGQNSSPQSEPGGSVPSIAAISDNHEGSSRNPSMAARSTNATASESRPSGSTATPPMPPIASESSPGLLLGKHSPNVSPASDAELRGEPTDTTTTMPSLSSSSGSVGPAISPTTSREREPGGADLPLDSLHSRFIYTAKASNGERPVVDGVAHPTVKPLSLMRWLVRLVTPPGGIVLDPFAGSGPTLEAALLEGFHVIGVEREAAYLPLIKARLSRVVQLPLDFATGEG